MRDTLSQWWAELQKVVNYPLIELGDNNLTLNSLIKFLAVVALVFVAERFLRSFLRRRVLARTHLSSDLQYAVSRFVGYCFIAIGFFFALKVIRFDLSALAVVFGALGIGVGFGLQNVIGNIVSGLVLLAERPIALGDRIEVAGVAGQVTKISLRSTTVVTNDNISIIVPNSDLVTQPITNWSHGDPKVRLRLPVGVAYGTDIEKLRAVLLAVAAEQTSVLADPAPTVFFDSFGESSLNFELALWTQAMAVAPRRFRSDINFAIERKLREHGIEIPFPQRVVHLRPTFSTPTSRQ
ncbi:MAG: mechanosensitive ion channel [Opitutae bacterium]|nr:mechanosensitive ion channel [Opitutae bacterium]